MRRHVGTCWLMVTAIWFVGSAARAVEPDWQQVKTYQYGQDMRPLLAVEREVYKSLVSPDQRKQVAARLVAIMADNQATPAARQFAGWELWVVGTEANVLALAKLLNDPLVADWAREALEMIPGEASGRRSASPWDASKAVRWWVRLTRWRTAGTRKRLRAWGGLSAMRMQRRP